MAISVLKQSTATTLLVGPIVDSADASAETGETIAQADVLLWKEGGTTLAAKNEATTCTHRSNGLYTCPVDATDTNTLGVLTVNVAKSGTLVWRGDYVVVPTQVYNSIVAGSDALQVDSIQFNGSATAAANQALAAGSALQAGTVFDDAGTYAPVLTPATSRVFYSDDVTEATADHYNGRVVIFTTGDLKYQALSITDYERVASYGKFTCSVSTEVPADDDTFLIV